MCAMRIQLNATHECSQTVVGIFLSSTLFAEGLIDDPWDVLNWISNDVHMWWSLSVCVALGPPSISNM